MMALRSALTPAYQQAWTPRARHVLQALPVGVVAAGRRSVAQALTAANLDQGGRAGPDGPASTDQWVATELVAPLLVEDDWPEPAPPLPVGSGAVHADLTDDDHELFAGLRHSLTDAAHPLEPEGLAAAAQELRLPVTPYRHPSSPPGRHGPDQRPAAARAETRPGVRGSQARSRRRDTPVVVDLTALWAGPLATGLLAQLGAQVVKIDPGCRPDGLGQHPGLYQRLNGAKTILDLDLRRPVDRAHFEALVADADLVIDSFSRRVMPNFDYPPEALVAHHPGLGSISVVAYPEGAGEQDWVSYGPGVHATSGLAWADGGGERGQGRFRPAPIAYPDVLAGLAAFATATEMLTDPARPRRAEISLAGALAPVTMGRWSAP